LTKLSASHPENVIASYLMLNNKKTEELCNPRLQVLVNNLVSNLDQSRYAYSHCCNFRI